MLSKGFRRLAVGVSILTAAAVLVYGRSAQAYSPCTIAFDDHYGLSHIDQQYMAYGFLQPVSPGPAVHIWYYNKCSSTGEWFYMDEDPATNYGELHIPNTDSTINCFTSNSTYAHVYGRIQTNGQCLAIDPLYVDRAVSAHQPDEQARIFDVSSNAHWRPQYITVLPFSANTKVTLKTANGNYWVYDNLTAGHTYNISGWPTGPGTGGVTAWIGTSAGQGGNIFLIDNLKIDYTTD